MRFLPTFGCRTSGRIATSRALIVAVLIALLSFAELPRFVLAEEDAQRAGFPEWIQGAGENLQLRLSGEVVRPDKGSTEEATVELAIKYNDRLFEVLRPIVNQGKFQAWVPVNKYHWYSIVVTATCPDGARSTKVILRHQLRQHVVDGLQLPMKLATRHATVQVEHNGKPVTEATVRAKLSGGAALRATTDGQGSAAFALSENDEFQHLTAWKGNVLIGGYGFNRKPIRDPKADTHLISMISCRPYVVQVIDLQGQAVADVALDFNAATPLPDVNYLGTPDGVHLVTDEQGKVNVPYYPDIENAHGYVELADPAWYITSTERGDKQFKVVATQAVKRQAVLGQVDGQGKFPGGFSVRLGSFQADEKNRIDEIYAFSDTSGNFAVDVLPGATYAAFLEDDKWVADTIDLIPYQADVEKTNSPILELMEGIPVRIELTQGTTQRPIPHTWVNIQAVHDFTWIEDGQQRHGALGRNGNTTTNAQGIVETVAPEGALEVSVYLNDWRATEKIQVRRGAENNLHIHRDVVDPVEVVGKIVPWNNDTSQIAGAAVHVKAIDGESGDEFQIDADEHGVFRFKTKAKKLGAIAYSADCHFAGSTIIHNMKEPFPLQLYPTKSFSGQITDQQGMPVQDHRVWASIKIGDERTYDKPFSTIFYVPNIERQTDAKGMYRFDDLPCNTQILLGTDTLDKKPNRFRSIDEVFFLPDDEPRFRVTKIGEAKSVQPKKILAQRYAAMLRDARLNGFHVMVLIHDSSQPANRDFVNRNLVSYVDNESVTGYMQLVVDREELGEDENKAFAGMLNWPPPSQGVLVIAYDAAGKELGRIDLSPRDSQAKQAANRFLDQYFPPQQDAEAKWRKAFEQASKENKRVWIRTGQRYCGPCFRLSRWIDDHHEMLEKDFILAKIDDVRDANGEEVAQRITQGRQVGVPFFAIYDAQGERLVDSFGPIGNIGFMSGLEGKRHFKMMMDAACVNISPEERQTLLDSLED